MKDMVIIPTVDETRLAARKYADNFLPVFEGLPPETQGVLRDTIIVGFASGVLWLAKCLL